jgi:hypothetical protein
MPLPELVSASALIVLILLAMAALVLQLQTRKRRCGVTEREAQTPPHHQLHNSLNGGSDGHGGIEDDVLPPALVPVPEALIDPTVVPVAAPLLDAETLLPP